MNMAAPAQQHTGSSGFDEFIKEEVSILAELHDKRVHELMAYSKGFLDKVFPLENGSHKDVRSYVVYYNHLLAFFTDGTKSGLQYPKQFVALSGHKSEPTSIVLKNDGSHVELIFNKNGSRGSKDIAGIDDIHVETQKVNFGSEYAANDEKNPGQKSRHWFSMIRNDNELVLDANGKTLCRCFDVQKAFTDKNGEDYPLS